MSELEIFNGMNRKTQMKYLFSEIQKLKESKGFEADPDFKKFVETYAELKSKVDQMDIAFYYLLDEMEKNGTLPPEIKKKDSDIYSNISKPKT